MKTRDFIVWSFLVLMELQRCFMIYCHLYEKWKIKNFNIFLKTLKIRQSKYINFEESEGKPHESEDEGYLHIRKNLQGCNSVFEWEFKPMNKLSSDIDFISSNTVCTMTLDVDCTRCRTYDCRL